MMQGRTLLVDAVSAYGVLPIYLLAAVFRSGAIPFSYVGLSLFVTLLVIAQYGLIYVLLRATLRSVWHALVALACVLLVNFITVHGAHPLFPSSGPLRFGLPFLLPLLVICRQRYARWARHIYLTECATVGTAAIWSLETFVYTSATYAGIIGYEAVVRTYQGHAWVRHTAARVAFAGLCVAGAYAWLALDIHWRSGQWPRLGEYLAYIRAFTSDDRLTTAPAPLTGAWIAIVSVYLGSLCACLGSVPRLRTSRGVAQVTVVCGMTLMGIAELSYYVGLSIHYRLATVGIPVVFVAAFWAERMPAALGERFRLAAVTGTYAAAALLAIALREPLVGWLPHSGFGAIARLLRGAPVTPPPGCPTLTACLTHAYPSSPQVAQALGVVEAYAPRTERLAVFLDSASTTEALFLTHKLHVFPLVDASHDSLLPSYADRILQGAHGLTPGDVIFVDRTVVDPARRAPVRDVFQLAQRFVTRMVDRVCHEFVCEPVARSGRISVERLSARPALGAGSGPAHRAK